MANNIEKFLQFDNMNKTTDLTGSKKFKKFNN